MAEDNGHSWRNGGPNATSLTKKAAGAWVQEAEAAMRDAPADTPHRRLLIECERQHCRWPVDGAGADLMVCGDLVRDGSSYCERHHIRAYAPPPWRTVSVGGVVRKVVGVPN